MSNQESEEFSIPEGVVDEWAYSAGYLDASKGKNSPWDNWLEAAIRDQDYGDSPDYCRGYEDGLKNPEK